MKMNLLAQWLNPPEHGCTGGRGQAHQLFAHFLQQAAQQSTVHTSQRAHEFVQKVGKWVQVRAPEWSGVQHTWI